MIEDPAAFRAAYEARLASEDPSRPRDQNLFRLVDYGVPDFDAIAPPTVSDDRLVFHAADDLIGLPYRVEARLDAQGLAEPHFEPMPLTPVPGLGSGVRQPAQAVAAQPGQVSPADDVSVTGEVPPGPDDLPVGDGPGIPPAAANDPDDVPR